MFRTRLAAVVLSGGLMLVTGCLQLPQGPGLFGRRTDPCCTPVCGDYGCTPPSPCGCGSMSLSQAPVVIPQDQIIPTMPQSYPLPRISTTPSPNVPFVP